MKSKTKLAVAAGVATVPPTSYALLASWLKLPTPDLGALGVVAASFVLGLVILISGALYLLKPWRDGFVVRRTDSDGKDTSVRQLEIRPIRPPPPMSSTSDGGEVVREGRG